MSEQLDLIYLPELSMSFSSLKKHLSELYNIQIQKKMSDSKKVRELYDKAYHLFNNYIGNNGKLDYSDKEYGYLADELEDVEVGYFKDESVDSDYAKRLRDEGFTMTEQEAIDTLQHRIESIEEEVGPVQYADGGGVGEMARGGYVSKGEMVWRKLTASERADFLYENFTPEITPRGQELLVGKDYNFLPRNVKMTIQSKYADMEEYADGGGVGKYQLIENKDGSYSVLNKETNMYVDRDFESKEQAQYFIDEKNFQIKTFGMESYFANGGGVDSEKVRKANEIYREHNIERKKRGIEEFSSKSVKLWKDGGYEDRLEKLNLNYEERTQLDPKKWYANGGGIEKFASGAKFTNSVNHLKDFIRQYPYIWTKNGKEYVPIEGWQYAALLMGYSARVTSVEQMGAGYMAKADVVDSRGNVVCSGFGYVDSNEAKWANKPVYQLIGFAQTRAVSRALRNCLSWMVKAAGYSTTPAEEMYGITPEKRGGGMKSRPFMPPAAPQEPDFIFDEPKYKAPMASSVPSAPVMPEDMGGLDAQQIEDTLREMNAKAKANNIVIVSPEFMDKIKDALLGTNTDLHMSMLNQAIDYMDKNNIVLQTPRYMSKLRKIASQKPF